MQKTIISSVQNPTIKSIVLLHEAKGRRERGEFIAEGLRTVQTLVESGIRLAQLYVVEGESIPSLATMVPDDQITYVSEPVMKKISTATTPSGILGVFFIPAQESQLSSGEGIVLAEVADPGNMGTLIRSAAAMERKTVVVIGGADPWSPKVVQSSAGTIGKVKLFQMDWPTLRAQSKVHDMRLIALVITGGKHPKQISFANSLLVVGNEARGIPSQWLSTCDEQMTLPMPGNIESFNAAVAGSIALYLAYEHQYR